MGEGGGEKNLDCIVAIAIHTSHQESLAGKCAAAGSVHLMRLIFQKIMQ